MAYDEYQKTAVKYDFLLSRPMRAIRNSITAVIAEHGHQRILDICCGTGEQLRLLHDNNRSLTGVDFSPAMLKQAKSKSPSSIHYIEADAGTVDLPVNTFDCVIISFALHEKPSTTASAIWDKAWELLGDGGHLLLADYCMIPENLRGRFVGRGAIPIIERLAGKEHYSHYIAWCKSGFLEGFIKKKGVQAQKISHHFQGTALICSTEKVED